jgi:hypothetical protein
MPDVGGMVYTVGAESKTIILKVLFLFWKN